MKIKASLAWLNHPASPGILLIACAVLAVAINNSPLSSAYEAGLHFEVLHLSAHEWVNDALMAIFFFTVGLEIKKEALVGDLSTKKKASLPAAGALGGMIVPALIYLAFNSGKEGAGGWGIPMATDIAFSLGVLSLVGKKVHSSLRIFLQALAVVDDLGAVMVIALFYTQGVSLAALLGAGLVFLVLILLHFFGIKKFAAYLPFGLLLWGLTFASGVHPTVAGVAFALCLPAELLVPLEHRLRPWMSFGVMPLFALANAGLRFAGTGSMEWMHPVSLGVFLGLFLGKQLGIFLASWISVRLGWSELASDSSWSKLSAVSWLGGIGFTMSLFISTLAFRDEALLAQAKLGILSGSIASGFVAFLFLRKAFRS